MGKVPLQFLPLFFIFHKFISANLHFFQLFLLKKDERN